MMKGNLVRRITFNIEQASEIMTNYGIFKAHNEYPTKKAMRPIVL